MHSNKWTQLECVTFVAGGSGTQEYGGKSEMQF